MRSYCDTRLARKGQRVVAIEITLRPLGPAADATRRRSRSLERSADRAGWRTASLLQASRSLQPESVCKLVMFPVQGSMSGLHGIFRAQARRIPPSKAAIRWLITASDFGGFERIAWERQRVADAIYRQPAKTLKLQGLRETPHRHAHSEAVAALELRVVGSKVGCWGVAWPNFCSNQCQSAVASCTGAVAAVSKKGTGPLSKRGQVPFFTVAR